MKFVTSSACHVGQAMPERFADGEVYVQIQENVRGCGRVCDAADVPAGGRTPDGVAADDRRVETRFGAAHHGGDSVLRVRAAGSQG